MRAFILVSSLVLVGCGSNLPTTIVAKDGCVKGLMLTTDCTTGTTPTPVATPSVTNLTVTGDVASPPPSGYTLNGSARFPTGTPNSWQALGQNSQPSVTKSFTVPMTLAGQCVPFDLKVKVGGSAPTHRAGTFYPAISGAQFKICVENGDVVVTFEDNVDNLFNDYKAVVSAGGMSKPLNYKWVAGALQICLD